MTSAVGQKLQAVTIYCDVNGTATFGDSTKEVDEIIAAVADDAIFTWEEGLPPMSKKDHIQKIVVPGDKYHVETKRRQEAEIRKFGEILLKLEPSKEPLKTKREQDLYNTLEKSSILYRTLSKDYLNPVTQRAYFSLFPSVVHFFQEANKIKSCSLEFRTFGPDGQDVSKEVDRLAHLNKFGEKGIECSVKVDSVEEWLANGRKAAFSKRVECIKGGNLKGERVIAIVLDDNLRKRKKEEKEGTTPANPNEQNIAFPVDCVTCAPVSWNDPGVIGIRVNTVKAAFDINYIVKKVNKQLIKRGLEPLSLVEEAL